MTDTYTRVVLTVIAAALVAIALRPLGLPIQEARAGDILDCRVQGRIEIDRWPGEISVEAKPSFDAPGTSSRPFVVQVKQ